MATQARYESIIVQQEMLRNYRGICPEMHLLIDPNINQYPKILNQFDRTPVRNLAIAVRELGLVPHYTGSVVQGAIDGKPRTYPYIDIIAIANKQIAHEAVEHIMQNGFTDDYNTTNVDEPFHVGGQDIAGTIHPGDYDVRTLFDLTPTRWRLFRTRARIQVIGNDAWTFDPRSHSPSRPKHHHNL